MLTSAMLPLLCDHADSVGLVYDERETGGKSGESMMLRSEIAHDRRPRAVFLFTFDVSRRTVRESVRDFVRSTDGRSALVIPVDMRRSEACPR